MKNWDGAILVENLFLLFFLVGTPYVAHQRILHLGNKSWHDLQLKRLPYDGRADNRLPQEHKRRMR